jgi:hypothetical protein
MRPAKIHELCSICDYKGKLETKDLCFAQSMTILRYHLLSSPGKIICAYLYHLFDALGGEEPPHSSNRETKMLSRDPLFIIGSESRGNSYCGIFR